MLQGHLTQSSPMMYQKRAVITLYEKCTGLRRPGLGPFKLTPNSSSVIFVLENVLDNQNWHLPTFALTTNSSGLIFVGDWSDVNCILCRRIHIVMTEFAHSLRMIFAYKKCAWSAKSLETLQNWFG